MLSKDVKLDLWDAVNRYIRGVTGEARVTMRHDPELHRQRQEAKLFLERLVENVAGAHDADTLAFLKERRMERWRSVKPYEVFVSWRQGELSDAYALEGLSVCLDYPELELWRAKELRDEWWAALPKEVQQEIDVGF